MAIKKIIVDQTTHDINLPNALTIKEQGLQNRVFNGSQNIEITIPKIEIDNILDRYSTNPVENNVIYSALEDLKSEFNQKIEMFLLSFQPDGVYSLSGDKLNSAEILISMMDQRKPPYGMNGDLNLNDIGEGGSSSLIPLSSIEIDADLFIINLTFSLAKGNMVENYIVDVNGNLTVQKFSLDGTTYEFEEGDENGQIKVTSSKGETVNVSVKGLGSAAYTDSNIYLKNEDVAEFLIELNNLLNEKVDKVEGKGLSTNDYTSEEKDKLGKIEPEANKTIVDAELSSTSTNPVQNKVVNSALSGKVPMTRTINDKALSSNITLSASDVGAAAASHDHNDIYYTEAEINTKVNALNTAIDEKVPTTRTINSKDLSSNIVLTAEDVGADPVGSASTAEENAKAHAVELALAAGEDAKGWIATAKNEANSYTDGKIDAIVGEGAADTLDTIGEISKAIVENKGILETLNAAIGNKANKSHNHAASDITSGTLSSDRLPVVPIAKGGTGATTAADALTNLGLTATASELNYIKGATSNIQTQLNAKVPNTRTVNGKALSADITLSASDVGAADSSHTHPSYVNQNAFSNVKVGSTTVAADTATDTLEIAAGTGISVAGDATNDKVTITNSGVRSISTGSTNGTISVNTNGASADVAVKGLGSAAYTNSGAYAPASHSHDDRYYTESEIDTKVSTLNTAINGKAASSHTHSISNVTNLQTTLDEKLPKSGGTVTGNITLDNSSSAQSGEPYLQWGTVGSNAPYIGFAHDQSDGTFIICSMEKDTTTNGVKYYRNGLSIGGGSGNLFWKGNRVVTATDLAGYSTTSHTHPAGLGIAIDSYNNNAIKNTGVISVATGSTNGTISVQTGDTVANVAVKGLGSAAYTNTTAYDPAGAAADAYESAQLYTLTQIEAAIDGDVKTLDKETLVSAKSYTDTKVASYLPLSGGTITGTVTFNASPITKANAFYNSYDTSSGGAVCLIGTANGNIQIGSKTSGQSSSNKNVVVASEHILRPASNASQSLGTSSYYWGTAYVNKLYIKDPGTTTNSTTTSDTYPMLKWKADGGAVCRYKASSSSRRYKTDIIEGFTDEKLNPENLYNVKLYQYKYKDDHLEKDDQRVGMDLYGFIVEDLVEHYPSAVDLNSKGEPDDWNKTFLIPAMLKLIQDQKKDIDILKEENQNLKFRLEKIENILNL